MKLKIALIVTFMSLFITTYSQQQFCADSSIRLRYIFGNLGAELFVSADTTGKNFFTGEYREIPFGFYGLPLLRTTWGDSILWAKKLYVPGTNVMNRNSFPAPNGTVICTGIWGAPISNHQELLISRIDTNGNVLWANRFKFNPAHLYYNSGNFESKNILIANNSIYFTGIFNDIFNVIAKLDLSGNLIWSKSFSRNGTYSGIVETPSFKNNKLLFAATAKNQQSPGPGSEMYTILSQLNDVDGSLIQSDSYKVFINALLKGIYTNYIEYNNDNSISISGQVLTDPFGTGIYNISNIVFNTLLDDNLMPIHNYYYNNTVLTNYEHHTEYNNKEQHALLIPEGFDNRNKYFFTFGKNAQILRSRKFNIATTYGTIYRNSLNFDDKENLHFVYQFQQANKFISEYARISNFSPSGTVGCFGKDTSILTRFPFNLIKEAFNWDNVASDVLISNPVVFNEDTAIVTKELVCKIVSYCDSINISGPDKACIGQQVRYSINKNNGCFKNYDWVIDTTFADIISVEGDSAITLNFKKAFSGYIHAVINDCVVKDSLFVTVVPPPVIKITNRDSLLCPGKSIVLSTIAGFDPYLWQDGSTAASYTVTSPGFYKVTGTNYCTIQSADSIQIQYSDTSFSIPATQTICKYDTAFIILPNDLTNIRWQPFTNSLLRNKTLLAYPIQNVTYIITGERQPNCLIRTATGVNVKRCSIDVFFPNSFTPNNDGHNDIFKILTFRPLKFYHFAIYNRYGQTVFETTNPAIGWDGTFKGKPQPIGGYTYRCSYYFTGGIQNDLSDTFILIR